MSQVSSESLHERPSGEGHDLSNLASESQDPSSNSEHTSEVVGDEKARLRGLSPSPPPQPPAPARISWKEPTPEKEDKEVDHSRPIFNLSSSQAAQSLHMSFNYPSGHEGPFQVKIDLASLLGLVNSGDSSSLRAIQSPYQQYASAPDSIQQQLTKGGQIVFESPRLGFHSLPPELRNRIYRMLFVKKQPVQLHSGYNLSRSSQFLSYQRQVYQEGASILYGLNKFVFTRSSYRVGRWFDSTISETGYSHVEECLRAIGHNNLSLMRHVAFVFTDACRITTPELTLETRRFVNDPDLERCLRRLGKYAKNLKTLSVNFQGKRTVARTDKVFLDALTTIMAEKVEIRGNLDTKIEKEVKDFLIFPGSSGPWMKVWNKPWEKAFGRRCR